MTSRSTAISNLPKQGWAALARVYASCVPQFGGHEDRIHPGEAGV